MAIDKLIPQYLNSDTDQKLVKSVEMTDNLNVRVSNDAEGTAGVLKNVKGNVALTHRLPTDAIPSGDNRVIGVAENEKNKEIIFLVWNNNSNHGIYRLDLNTNKYRKLYEDSVLNFQKYSYASCDVIVNEDGESLFYWTDDVNPPMKVNVDRLIKNAYPSILSSGTDEEKLSLLTVAKERPTKAPQYSIVNNPNLGRNQIREKHFQFAYRYKYKDGEVSALSEWSSFSVSSVQLKDGLVKDSAKLDFYNQINVFVQNSKSDVDKITIYAREIKSETFFQIDEIDNNFTSNYTTVKFTNDKLGSPLSLDEVRKSYDNVPQLAKALSITNNRLMYGNYTEGYENVDVDIKNNPVYRKEENIYSIKAYVDGGSAAGATSYGYSEITADSNTNYVVKIDYSDLPANIAKDSFINIDFIWTAESVHVTSQARYDSLKFDFVTDLERFTEKLGNDMLYGSGEITTPTQKEYTIPIKNTIFSHSYRTASSRTKAQIISDINNRLSDRVFHGIVDSDTALDRTADIYFNSGAGALAGASFFGLTGKARAWLEGVASFKLQQGDLNGDIKSFNLKFAGASVSVKAATVLDVGLFNTTPVPVKIVGSSRTKIDGEAGFSHYTGVATKKIEYKRTGISGSSSFIAEKLEGYRSFKSDANHSFGVVYFDDRGRAGGVNEISSVFIEPTSQRDAKGASSVDFRINSKAPSWAKRWQMVYAGNNTVDKFLQYTVGSALIPKEVDEFTSQAVYVSLNTLEGTRNSYKESFGSNLEYKFEEGDVIKVLRYKNGGSYVYPDNVEFNVLGYEKLNPDNDRFVAPEGFNYESKNGYVLQVEQSNIEGWDFNSVKAGSSLWDNEVLVEIYTPKKETEEKVYFGVGKTYDVVDGQHYGDRTITSSAGGDLVIDGNGGATSSDRFYAGDKITVSGSVIVIDSVTIEKDGTFSYKYIGSVAAQSNAAYTVNNYTEANVSVTNGDVFYRARRLITREDSLKTHVLLSLNWDEHSFSSVIGFIEDYSVSDFYKSDGAIRNKPYAFIPEAKTLRRRSSITYSDAFVLDSDRLNLSSFNLSLANWKDLDVMNGGVSALVSRGDSLTVIQETKVCQLPLGKNIIEFNSGNANITASKNVLGNEQYYAGDYGTSNPESVVERFGVVYFVDAEAGKIIRLSSDGITPISEKGMDSFFEDELRKIRKGSRRVIAIGGFDPRHDEYLVTIESVHTANITIGSDINELPSDENSNITFNLFAYTSQTVIWNVWGNLWNEFCGNWEDVGNGVVFVDAAFNIQGVLIDSALAGNTGTVNVIVTDSGYTFAAIGSLDLSTGIVTMPSTTCDGTNITIADAEEKSSGFTISYKHKQGVWGSKYSFKPSMYANINNELFSFFDNADNKLVWHHDENDTRNKFYNNQYNSVFEVVSNRNPSMVKVFEAIAIEGNGDWSGTITTDDQSTSVTTSSFDEREGHKYAMIPRDSLSSKSHEIYLGEIESIDSSTNEVTFTTPINRIPFVVGDALQTVVGGTKTSTGTSITDVTGRKTIKCGSVSNLSVGNDVMVSHTASVDGDAMRGVFLKCKMTSTNTTAFEVHALSLSYDRSRLHNDRVN